ncbi:MAG: MarR family winged helix-turn-helix transcriptional regulator [Nakamurella sp.]
MAAPPDPSLGWSIGLLFRTWQDGVSTALSGLPHGARGFQILVTVTESEPPTQAALAAHLGIDRTVLTYVLDDLVEAGLLERKIDASDRRVRRLVATTAGRRLLKTSEKKVAAAELELLEGLTADEQVALRVLLERAAGQIHHREPGHDACSVVADILGEPPAAEPRARSSRPGRARV